MAAQSKPTPARLCVYERVNRSKLLYMLLKANEGDIVFDSDEQQNNIVINILSKYCDSLDSNGGVMVKYVQKDYGYGRLFQQNGGSLQSMSKMVRNTIASEIYYDIDMVNAHPTILYHYCVKNNIDCDKLEDFINNREEFVAILTDAGYSRDDAKSHYLSLINYDSNNCDKTVYGSNTRYKNFVREIKTIIEDISDIETDKLTVATENQKAKGKKNFQGSCINHLMCSIEHTLLMEIYEFFKTKDLILGSLMFDGLYVERTVSEEQMNAYLRELEPQLSTPVLLKIKDPENIVKINLTEMKEMIPSSHGWDPVFLREIRPYKQTKVLFENICFKNLNDGTYVHYSCSGEYKRITLEDLVRIYGHYKTIVQVPYKDGFKPKKMSFIKSWLDDPEMKTVNNVVFCPRPLDKTVNKNDFNAWDGFPYDRYTPTRPVNTDSDDIKFILEYLKRFFGESEMQYILNWLAELIQRPGVKPSGAALVIYSRRKGSGKTTFTYLCQALIGESRTLITANPKSCLYGSFNARREGTFVIGLEEADPKTSFTNEDQIKSMITETVAEINQKNIKQYKINVFERFIFTTNSLHGVPVNNESRRFAPFEAKYDISASPDSKEFFNKLYSIIRDKHSMFEFYTYLMRFNITIDIVKDIPQTFIRKLMNYVNVNPFDRFMAYLAHEHMPKFWDAVPKGPLEVQEPPKDYKYTQSQLYKVFTDWCSETRNTESKMKQFAARLRAYSEADSQEKLSGIKYDGISTHNKSHTYSINIQALQTATASYL